MFLKIWSIFIISSSTIYYSPFRNRRSFIMSNHILRTCLFRISPPHLWQLVTTLVTTNINIKDYSQNLVVQQRAQLEMGLGVGINPPDLPIMDLSTHPHFLPPQSHQQINHRPQPHQQHQPFHPRREQLRQQLPQLQIDLLPTGQMMMVREPGQWWEKKIILDWWVIILQTWISKREDDTNIWFITTLTTATTTAETVEYPAVWVNSSRAIPAEDWRDNRRQSARQTMTTM
jgi:hypothetical protein